jgi:hypothetical protein
VNTAVFADFDIDIKDSYEALHPSHGAVPLSGAFALPVVVVRF